MLHVTAAQRTYFFWVFDNWRQRSKFRLWHPSSLYTESHGGGGGGGRIDVLPASTRRMRKGDDPQWTTIMSHRVACYSKGAELASSSAADAHLFWHFMLTLTQKTHDNATLCISKVQAVFLKPLHFSFSHPHDTYNHFPHTFRAMTEHYSCMDKEAGEHLYVEKKKHN